MSLLDQIRIVGRKKEVSPVAIYGAGGFGLEVAMLIQQINAVTSKWNLIGFFDDGKPVETVVNDWSVLGGIKELNAWSEPLAVVFALGHTKTREAVLNKINNPNIWYPTLIHPSVIMGASEYVQIGEGSIVSAGNIITSNINIGRHVILNLACTIGHETYIGDFCSFMPTCNISGEVKVGNGSFWGTGAKIINGKSVGDYTTIGAGAVVTTDIPSDSTAVGVPARVIKQE